MAAAEESDYYEVRRREVVLKSVKKEAKDAADDYEEGAHTIVLLPGGMGSELERSGRAVTSMQSKLGFFDEVWIDSGILRRDLLTLPIDAEGRDERQYIIRPDGFLSVLGVSPYDGTRDYFRNKCTDGGAHFNFTTCAFDWRRPLLESARMLLAFLREYQRLVKDECGDDPLPMTTLVGHSQGGMVAKVFLDLLLEQGIDPERIGEYVDKVITVGTGFYGVTDHLARLYKGQDYLNELYKPKVVATVAASLKAPYTFLFLDQELWERDGGKLGIERYPLRDADRPQKPADPYDRGSFSRYPPWVRPDDLEHARDVRTRLTDKLPPPVQERVFHIRSLSEPTYVELFWSDVNGSDWDTSSPSPVSGVEGDGDGGVPKWSAILADTPRANVYDLMHGGEHNRLMEYQETLDHIVELVTGESQSPVSVRTFLGHRRASDEEARRFLRDDDSRSTQSAEKEQEIWLRLLEGFAFD